jgi:putative membrane protein
MKKIISLLLGTTVLLAACNSEGANSNTGNDSSSMSGNTSANNNDTTSTVVSGDNAGASTGSSVQEPNAATKDFMTKAADGGMAEVEGGKMASDKATRTDVKNFGSMMVSDHSAANEQLKSLASARNVSLPQTISAEHKHMATQMEQKKGKAFDKAYIDMMVKDHQKDISLFEKAQSETNDDAVRSFITNTLPTLRMHLDSARAIQARIK